MAEMSKRRLLPVGLQSFEEIRKEGYLYVDKTDLVWQLVNNGSKYDYLSRPRRFGKSLLVDTLACYLSGKKELFEGLKIMDLEQDWVKRPVIRFDMSRGGATAEEVRSYLDLCFADYEEIYGVVPKTGISLADRFDRIIKKACEQTGQKVAILIDEYDSPLQHSWHTPHHEECTAVYRSVFAILKADDNYEQFVFITGITKFTQISLFSVMNNLVNISFFPEYAALCGITEQEISDNFQPEMQRLAEQNGWTLKEAHERLKNYYDGYHFSEGNMTDIYNPFSLVNALSQHKLGNFWVSSGATSMLPKFIDDAEIRMEELDGCAVMGSILESSDVTGGGAELFLYQSGYLTIKSYQDGYYILGFPNEEVRQALFDAVLPALTMRQKGSVVSLQSNLYYRLVTGQVPEAMKVLKSLIADVPYSNKKLASMDMEERYRLIISTVLNAIGLQVEVERQHAKGRIDIVAKTSRYIDVMELKLSNNGGVQAAEEQMAAKQYLEPFLADGRTVIGLALELDAEGKGLMNWTIIELGMRN